MVYILEQFNATPWHLVCRYWLTKCLFFSLPICKYYPEAVCFYWAQPTVSFSLASGPCRLSRSLPQCKSAKDLDILILHTVIQCSTILMTVLELISMKEQGLKILNETCVDHRVGDAAWEHLKVCSLSEVSVAEAATKMCKICCCIFDGLPVKGDTIPGRPFRIWGKPIWAWYFYSFTL